ncbi:MAG: hypothetical protein KatS3mg114_1268 [Planctomycetaceae bacterium]|nr:MAG: hypothetical protein KatS3mg114_1268 [Planctomycetaceae bacterium]
MKTIMAHTLCPSPRLPRATPTVHPAPRRTLGGQVSWLTLATGLNFAALLLLWWSLTVLSETWWFTSVLTYLPRHPWLVPGGLLLGLSLMQRAWYAAGMNLLSLAIVAGPVMDYRWGGYFSQNILAATTSTASATNFTLRVATCNVQAYQPHFAQVFAELQRWRPDVILLQEAATDHPLLSEFFPAGFSVHTDHYWIGSRYPLQLRQECLSTPYQRTAGIIVELETPVGMVMLANVHLMTPRRSLQEFHLRSLLDGSAPAEHVWHTEQRLAEALEVRMAIDRVATAVPLIVAGDFNTPVTSNLYRTCWSDLQNAFDVRGCGWGYTAPCKPHPLWPWTLPWTRIDHILCSAAWQVLRCERGSCYGSDHHSLFAELLCTSPMPSTGRASAPNE